MSTAALHTLGLTHSATADCVRRAFRSLGECRTPPTGQRMRQVSRELPLLTCLCYARVLCRAAKKYHPDANPGVHGLTEKFQKLTHAYETAMEYATRATIDGGQRWWTAASSMSRPRRSDLQQKPAATMADFDASYLRFAQGAVEKAQRAEGHGNTAKCKGCVHKTCQAFSTQGAQRGVRTFSMTARQVEREQGPRAARSPGAVGSSASPTFGGSKLHGATKVHSALREGWWRMLRGELF